ncbi:hypothetical protein NDU88_001888, partial [Pleurodeles waltl]
NRMFTLCLIKLKFQIYEFYYYSIHMLLIGCPAMSSSSGLSGNNIVAASTPV